MATWEHLSAAPEELKEVGPERKLWTSIVSLRSCGPGQVDGWTCVQDPSLLLDIVYVLPWPSSIFAVLLHVRLFAFGFKEQDKHCGGVFLTPSFHQLPPAETKRDLAPFGLGRVFFFLFPLHKYSGFFLISPVGLHCFRVMSTVSFGFTVLANDFAGLSAPFVFALFLNVSLCKHLCGSLNLWIMKEDLHASFVWILNN